MASLSAMVPLSSATSALLPLPAQALPIGEPFGNLGLEAARARFVEGLRAHFLRPVIVAGKGVFFLMVVAIAFAVADVLHEAGRRIEDRLRRHQRASFLRGLPGGFLRAVGGVGFGRRRAIEAGLDDRQFALRRTKEVVGILGGQALDQRLRIG